MTSELGASAAPMRAQCLVLQMAPALVSARPQTTLPHLINLELCCKGRHGSWPLEASQYLLDFAAIYRLWEVPA